jgi:DinB superfamily
VAFVNPYQALIDRRDPVQILEHTLSELPAQMRIWAQSRFVDTYAPGKRAAHRILLHLLHVELVDSVRLRMALSTPDYAVQPFEPDAWMRAESLDSSPMAISAWSALRAINLVLWKALPALEWNRAFQHPEYGTMTLRDLAGLWAGHDVHRLNQLRAIEEGSRCEGSRIKG